MSTLKDQALAYHASPKAGKLAVQISKPMQTQHDLALAYSPGVAAPVQEIAAHAENAYQYTNLSLIHI